MFLTKIDHWPFNVNYFKIDCKRLLNISGTGVSVEAVDPVFQVFYFATSGEHFPKKNISCNPLPPPLKSIRCCPNYSPFSSLFLPFFSFPFHHVFPRISSYYIFLYYLYYLPFTSIGAERTLFSVMWTKTKSKKWTPLHPTWICLLITKLPLFFRLRWSLVLEARFFFLRSYN